MTTTIEGLRINQWGIEGTKATVTLTMDTQPTAADTVTLGSKVYTWKASGAAADGEINRGADLAAAKVNFVAAVNGTDSINKPHPNVSAAAFASNDCVITARIPGTGGNSIASTETFSAGTNVFSAATLTGGTYARGTAVAATSKIAIEKFEWLDDAENIYRPHFANGLLIRNRTNGTNVQHGTGFSFSDQPMVWEQIMHWLSMCVTGNPTVTYITGSPDVYRWVFTRDPTTNPSPQSMTFQRRFSDGSNNVDQRAAYAMLSELGLKYAQNEHLRMDGAGFARKFETSAITASLSLPTSELGVSALSKVYVDDNWASLGGSLLTEQVIGWEWKFMAGAFPRYTAEGRTNLDFTKHDFDAAKTGMSLKLTVLLDTTTYAAEAAKAAAASTRAVRLNIAGSGGRLMKIDGLFQYTKGALFKIGESEGGDTVEINLEETSDATNFLSVTVEHPSVRDLS